MHHGEHHWVPPNPYIYGPGHPQPHGQNLHRQMDVYRSDQPMYAHAPPMFVPPTFTPLVSAPWTFTPPPPPSHPPPPPSYPPPTYGPGHHQPVHTLSQYAFDSRQAYQSTFSRTVHHHHPLPPKPKSEYNGHPDSQSSTTNTSHTSQLPKKPPTSTTSNTPCYPQAQPSRGVAEVSPPRESPRKASSPPHWPILSEPQICIPPEAFVAPHAEAFLLMIAQDQEDIPRLPSDRNRIWHAVCGRMHAPEECRGPLTKGTLGGCVLCGRSEHMTDDCGYWLLLPQNERSSLKRYLYIFSRQGLPPLASRKDFTSQDMDGLRPPLCPITATHYEHKQNQLDRQAGQYRPYHARFNYDALANTQTELTRLPEEDPCLGKWKTSGPPPNRLAEWVKSDFLGREYAVPYDPSWTLFANKHVRSYGKRVVKFPRWVTHVESLVELDSGEGCQNVVKHRRNESPQQVSIPVPKKTKLTPIYIKEKDEVELPYGTPDRLSMTGDNPVDVPEEPSETQADLIIIDQEQAGHHEDDDSEALVELSSDEVRKTGIEDEPDESPPPQSAILVSRESKPSMTQSDATKHEENGEQQEGRPGKLLKAGDEVVERSENPPSVQSHLGVVDIQHADHDDQQSIALELEFECPNSPDWSSEDQASAYDFEYNPASPDWSRDEEETNYGQDLGSIESPDWGNV